jgi:hypothetical protein
MTHEERDRLAERIVAVLKDAVPEARIAELREAVDAGDEGEDGTNSVVLAVAIAMVEQAKKR